VFLLFVTLSLSFTANDNFPDNLKKKDLFGEDRKSREIGTWNTRREKKKRLKNKKLLDY
jgi:hypothetical protein